MSVGLRLGGVVSSRLVKALDTKSVVCYFLKSSAQTTVANALAHSIHRAQAARYQEDRIRV